MTITINAVLSRYFLRRFRFERVTRHCVRFFGRMEQKLLLAITANMLNYAFGESTTVVSQAGRFSPEQTKPSFLGLTSGRGRLCKLESFRMSGRRWPCDHIARVSWREIARDCHGQSAEEHAHHTN